MWNLTDIPLRFFNPTFPFIHALTTFMLVKRTDRIAFGYELWRPVNERQCQPVP